MIIKTKISTPFLIIGAIGFSISSGLQMIYGYDTRECVFAFSLIGSFGFFLTFWKK